MKIQTDTLALIYKKEGDNNERIITKSFGPWCSTCSSIK